MRKKYPSIVRALLVLTLVVALTGVLAVLPASAATTVTLSTMQGPVGTPVTVNVTDALVDQGQPVVVLFDGIKMDTTPAAPVVGTTGTVYPQITVPLAAGGPHDLVVMVGAKPYPFTVATGNPFTVEPKVTISPKRGPVQTPVTVTGTGFTPGTTARITIDGEDLDRSAAIDSTGSFKSEGKKIPVALTAGNQMVDAIDGHGLRASNYDAPPKFNSATFKVEPTLTVDPAEGLAGSAVYLNGSGFADGNIQSFAFAGAGWEDPSQNPYTANIPASGMLVDKKVVIPASASRGVKTIVVTDADGNIGSTTFNVLARELAVQPAQGPKGTRVLITGSKMTQSTTTVPTNNSIIAIGDLEIEGYDMNTGGTLPTGEQQPGIIRIDTTGKLSPTTAYVPSTAVVGMNEIRASDGGADFNRATPHDNLLAYGDFEVTKPSLSVTPLSGARNELVTVTGAGWVPNSQVTVEFDNKQVAIASVDANGNFGAGLNVPNVADAGTFKIEADDDYGNVAAAIKFQVPDAQVTVTPTEGIPGVTDVTITGSGFLAYATVEIWIGSAEIGDRPFTDKYGAFQATVRLPGGPEGSAVVSARTGDKNATTSFVILEELETVQSAMRTVMDKLDIIWGYVKKATVLDWYFYDPDDPEGSAGPEGLLGLEAGQGYWVKVTADAVLIFGGHRYELNQRWNNIGWRGK